jgi:hypothetical protein
LADGLRLDLVVLVPDADWEQTIRALLECRARALGIRHVDFEVIRHPLHDPGVRTQAALLLQPYVGEAQYALACVDSEGSGHHGRVGELEGGIESSLRPDWDDRCGAVVVEPELEAWVWSSSPNVASALGWNTNSALHGYLRDHGMLAQGEAKPSRPKEAMLAAMRERGKRRSPSVFAELASNVSLVTCGDPTFAAFRARLQAWFPL